MNKEIRSKRWQPWRGNTETKLLLITGIKGTGGWVNQGGILVIHLYFVISRILWAWRWYVFWLNRIKACDILCKSWGKMFLKTRYLVTYVCVCTWAYGHICVCADIIACNQSSLSLGYLSNTLICIHTYYFELKLLAVFKAVWNKIMMNNY